VEESGENHRPDASHWQTLSHNVVSGIPHLSGIRAQALVVIGTECMGSCKSNYHTIMTTTSSVSTYNNMIEIFLKK